MKLFLYAITLSTLFLTPEAKAHKIGHHHHHYGTKHARCYTKIYKEKHIHGTWDSPGYIKITKKKEEVPCFGHKRIHVRGHKHHHKHDHNTKLKVFIDL